MWHTGTGIIQYDPRRGKMTKRTKWWCVVGNVDREITRYYRTQVAKRYHLHHMCQPSWDAHISIIRGERPPKHLMHLWKKYEGLQVEFRYKHYPRQSGDTTGNDRPGWYWFVEVDFPLGIQIREEFGFPSNWKLHLTVGRTYY
jgi:hypothetical protein